MHELSYRVCPEIFAAFPGYVRGVLVFDQLDNRRPAPEITRLLREAEQGVREAITGSVADWPVVAAWRQAYRDFGAKPSEHRSSIEALLRRVLKPDALPSINPLVDIGSLVSIRHGLPAGVHPLANDEPVGHRSLELRQARSGDAFVESEGALAQHVPPGEVVLADGARVLTRRWTWRQSAGTRTQTTTQRVFFDIDGLPPVTPSQVGDAMRQVEILVREHCGGRLRASAVLTREAPALRTAFD